MVCGFEGTKYGGLRNVQLPIIDPQLLVPYPSHDLIYIYFLYFLSTGNQFMCFPGFVLSLGGRIPISLRTGNIIMASDNFLETFF